MFGPVHVEISISPGTMLFLLAALALAVTPVLVTWIRNGKP